MVSVVEMLLYAAERCGDEVALKDVNESISYNGLLVLAHDIAVRIKELIEGRNNLILVITTKSVKSVMAFWGIAASENYYVAVDSKTPENRFEEIVNRIEPKMIIFTEEGQEDYFPVKIPSFSLENTICEREAVGRQRLSNAENYIKSVRTICADPLYMVFTSGSTGCPKAIVKSHQSVLTFIESFVGEFNLDKTGERETLGNQAAFDFDVSAKDIYVSASIGAKLCIIPSGCFLVPGRLSAYLEDNGITMLIWAASAVKYIERFDCFRKIVPTQIKRVFFSGESMPGKCIDYWRIHLPDAIYVNLYAPSEVTGNCLYHIVSEQAYQGILPLDAVFSNSEVMILGEDRTVTKEGEKGEIYVRGSFLSQGYYNDPEQTSLKFVQNPMHNNYPDIVYKTGDYVTIQDGKYYFAGRVDNQIKHMGHRIELEEIENKIIEIFGYDKICVVYDSEEERIVMLTDETEMLYINLVNQLKTVIPKYMIPHEIFFIGNIPLNARGKVDRKRAFAIYKEEKNA